MSPKGDLTDWSDDELRPILEKYGYDDKKDNKVNSGLRRMRWINFVRKHCPSMDIKRPEKGERAIKVETVKNEKEYDGLPDDEMIGLLTGAGYDFSKDGKMNIKLRRVRWTNFLRKNNVHQTVEVKLPKNYYFDNAKVEGLLTRYVNSSCTDVKLRDEIMVHASELIRQIIRAHGLQNIYPGREDSSFYDLFQTGWVQIESALYKFVPGKAKVFNMLCLNPETKVFSDRGVISLSEALDCNKRLFGLNGLKQINASIKKPIQQTKIVTIQLGYELEATPEHHLYRLGSKGPEWVQVKDLKKGDLLGMQFGQYSFTNNNDVTDITLLESGNWKPPKKITPKLAYLFGLYLAEGSYSRREFDIVNADQEVIDFLTNNNLGLLFKRHNLKSYTYCRRFGEFWDKLGFDDCHDSHTKKIPTRLLAMSQENVVAMLQGLFDGDGHSSRFNGVVGYTSTSRDLINQIRMLLLNFGIFSKISKDERTTRIFPGGYESQLYGAYQLQLSTSDSEKFYSRIGFKIKRKQNKRSQLSRARREPMYGLNIKFLNLYRKYGPRSKYDQIKKVLRSWFISLEKVKKVLVYWSDFSTDEDYLYIKERIDEFEKQSCGITWLPVVGLEDSRCAVCDVEVNSPDHSYIANGFISHNSQVARTVMLAYIKKEGRDRKNSPGYKDIVVRKATYRTVVLDRFMTEASEICKYNRDYTDILLVMENLFLTDPKLHEGLIGKLARESGKPKKIVSEMLDVLRMRSHEFTDSPINDRPIQILQGVADDED
ncbi:MAG: LAGLIDADG family homing endonuclease [Candidatus Nanopelagicaceae bacterium]|nr:LAGLIDADG family homing endonuclease [Candidatus Nanopelagicaceae bacterium]